MPLEACDIRHLITWCVIHVVAYMPFLSYSANLPVWMTRQTNYEAPVVVVSLETAQEMTRDKTGPKGWRTKTFAESRQTE
jgi:hypothetical protein